MIERTKTNARFVVILTSLLAICCPAAVWGQNVSQHPLLQKPSDPNAPGLLPPIVTGSGTKHASAVLWIRCRRDFGNGLAIAILLIPRNDDDRYRCNGGYCNHDEDQ